MDAGWRVPMLGQLEADSDVPSLATRTLINTRLSYVVMCILNGM